MSFIEKMKSQLSRIFGLDFSTEMTDAEVLDKLESIESISELRTQVAEQKDTIEEQTSGLQTLQTSYDEISEKITALESNDQITALKDSISDLKTSMGQELNALKMGISNTDPKSGGPELPKTKETESKQIKGDGSFLTKRFVKGQINN